MHLNPAQYVIQMFGGVRATARAIGRVPGAVINWKRAKSRGGNGGEIPGPSQRLILIFAKKKGMDITPNDLAYGRDCDRRIDDRRNAKTIER